MKIMIRRCDKFNVKQIALFWLLAKKQKKQAASIDNSTHNKMLLKFWLDLLK
jgi:hypothetical protein